MPTQKSNTKVVTGIVRLSYEHVWEPASINGSNPKYSVSLIIPKSDTKTIAAINAAVDAAIKDGVAKFGGKVPPKGALKLPLRDGDAATDSSSRPDTGISTLRHSRKSLCAMAYRQSPFPAQAVCRTGCAYAYP